MNFALRRWRRLGLALLVLCGALLGPLPAQAHLMAAQKGTLNLVADAAFLVLSVPVSALVGVDDDRDGVLSRAELATHADAIRTQVQAGVQLRGPAGARPLQVVMLDAATPDGPAQASGATTGASHLTILGRFALQASSDRASGPATVPSAIPSDGLTLQFILFGTQANERQQHLTITREQETQWLRFTPEQSAHALLPGTAAVLAQYVRTGAAHVLGGADHLMFLLVVLAAGWSWRGGLGALTCFTAGHALTLVACVWGGWSAPERLVEPAIAATIVGMTAFDAWSRSRGRPVSLGVRLALVFTCALIHGLGLAGALTDLTQWPSGSRAMLWALAGFNLGIEAAQVVVAAGAYLLWWGLRRLIEPSMQRRASQFATLAVMATGSIWFAERLLQLG